MADLLFLAALVVVLAGIVSEVRSYRRRRLERRRFDARWESFRADLIRNGRRRR